MRKWYCYECDEWIYEMPLSDCYQYKNGMCNYKNTGCDAKRYVRADVAMRYARAEARKAYNLAMEYGYSEDENEDGKTDVWYERTFEEAKQASQMNGN